MLHPVTSNDRCPLSGSSVLQDQRGEQRAKRQRLLSEAMTARIKRGMIRCVPEATGCASRQRHMLHSIPRRGDLWRSLAGNVRVRRMHETHAPDADWMVLRHTCRAHGILIVAAGR